MALTEVPTENPTEYVDAISLNDVIARYGLASIDLLKIDIEGGERYNSNEAGEGLAFLDITRVVAIEIHDEFQIQERILTICGKPASTSAKAGRPGGRARWGATPARHLTFLTLSFPMPSASPPLVSAAMPVYNAAPFVEVAIASILDERFTDFELLLFDDGSTDAAPTASAALPTPASNCPTPYGTWAT